MMFFYIQKTKIIHFPCDVFAAPCQAHKDSGFQVLVGLPKGTNVGCPDFPRLNTEDKLLTATNKWLLAHAEASEAKDGAWVGITGENIDIENDIQ